ncbi:MAG TPA: HAD family hydrolase [Acidimicrobiia bacterium]|nr:HAD family hydrolase [Acidimicrobiia bacterium]
MIDIVAFDADDTLWHNERLFIDTQRRFRELLGRHRDADVIEQRLYDTEVANLQHYGYGIKAFTLSMIETAIDLTEGEVTGDEITEILHWGREMLLAPVDLLPGVEAAITRLADRYPLMVITKGDLLDQETKLARSGLGDFFSHVEVVSRKDRGTYEEILARHGLGPERFVMVGNSLRSDVVPVAEMGAHAMYVPYETTWAHEDVPPDRLRHLVFHTLESIEDLPRLLEEIAAGGDAGHQ